MIALNDVSYAYRGRPALEHVTALIQKGEHVALIGPNASGKSTLAMIMNALLPPTEGDCVVDGVNTKDDPMYARKAVGMVFQDPESQAVARRVRDDVAFGPANLGVPEKEIALCVSRSLAMVGMESLIDREVSSLSGGQKQLLAIAGVLAMGPSYILFDEPAALLDANGARSVRDAIDALKKNGIGIVVITHDMEDAARADRILALQDGRLISDMPVTDLFSDRALMSRIGVEPPFGIRLQKAMGTIPVEIRRCL